MEKYANFYGWTDIEPYEVVKVISDKTIEIRKMKSVLDDWKPNYIPGGFSIICTNINTQKYIITSDETAPIIRARKNKEGKWKSSAGWHRLEDVPRKFFDYNF